jgi:hypothetical protein
MEKTDGQFYWLRINGKMTVGRWDASWKPGTFWVCGDDLPFNEGDNVVVISHIEPCCGDPCDALCECED